MFAAAPLHKVNNPVPGRYIVTLKSDTPANSHAESLARSAGAELGHVFHIVLNGFAIVGTEQKALALTKLPGVEAVWEVPVARPTDTQFGAADGPDRIDQRNLPLNDTFVFSMYSTPTTIYMVDTGIDPRAEFGDRLTKNINFHRDANGIRDPNNYTDYGLPLDDFYHGTSGAVIAAGGQNGIARFAKLANVRVCHSLCAADDILAGIDWVTQQRQANPSELHIANASYTGKYLSYPPTDAAYQASINAGVAWVFGAGNGDGVVGEDACQYYPARLAAQYSGAMSVGAASPNTDRVFNYSNQGPCVDIFAPGSTDWGIPNRTASGTSIAAPHVTGVFAVRWANAPTVTAGEIEGVIKGVGTPGVLSNVWATSPNLLLYSLLPRRRAVGP
jgi:subtilisin family serine protease